MAKKKITKKTTKKVAKREAKLGLSISLNDTVQNVKGDTVEELFEKVELPEFPSTPALLTFKKGKEELFINIPVARMRNYIVNPDSRQFFHDQWQGQIDTI